MASSDAFTSRPSDDSSVPYAPGGKPYAPGGQLPGTPGERPTVAVAVYPDYAAAQRAVDFLSDNKFPVNRVSIVGTDLRLVEKVLGRMTVGRAALAGAGTGAWFGLFIGILLGVFAVAAWWRVILFALLAGIVWGAVFGAVAHGMTGGRRDFTSASALQAETYTLMIDAEHAEQARRLLERLR